MSSTATEALAVRITESQNPQVTLATQAIHDLGSEGSIRDHEDHARFPVVHALVVLAALFAHAHVAALEVPPGIREPTREDQRCLEPGMLVGGDEAPRGDPEQSRGHSRMRHVHDDLVHPGKAPLPRQLGEPAHVLG